MAQALHDYAMVQALEEQGLAAASRIEALTLTMVDAIEAKQPDSTSLT